MDLPFYKLKNLSIDNKKKLLKDIIDLINKSTEDETSKDQLEVQRIMQKLNLQVISFTRKKRKYSSYKGKVGTVAPNRIRKRFNTHMPH